LSHQKAAVPEPSEIAGRYQIVKKLGAGAFGTVYKAKDKILGRMVAIKTIRMEGLAAAGASIEELVDRFSREARVSAQLKHPNIVTIYDVGESDGLSYLAMEFIDGQGLDRVIAADGQMTLERAANIGAQVADALDFAHKASVVHRDIKPANIMIEAGDRVKVTDFGIAKVTDSGEHLTMTGSLLGTPSYMSPEQARGAALDGRSDLFAVGCILYEMLAGKKAFRGESITGLIFKIITEEPPPIRDMAEVPDEAVRIISKALAKTPEQRYQNGRELADDLLALTRAGTTPTIRQVDVATAPGLPAVGATIASRPAAAPLPTLNTPLATVAQSVAQPPAPRPAPPPPPAAAAPAGRPAPRSAAAGPRPAPPSSSRAGLFIGLGLAAFFFLAIAAGGAWYAFGRKTTTDTASTAGGTLSGQSGATAGTPAASPEAAATGTDAPSTVATAPPPGETAATLPGDSASTGTRTADSGTRPPTGTTGRPADSGPVATTPPVDPGPATAEVPRPRGADFTFLDDEPSGDGRAAGDAVADQFRNNRGSQSGPYGSTRRFNRRERSPRDLMPVERPAVATIRYVIERQELLKRRTGHYGTLNELVRAADFRLDVAHGPQAFQRRGYKFEMDSDAESFKLTATPLGPNGRSFTGDDSGIIREGLE
jgi:eukaryotic-like serine/threonine-protein kinase